MDLFAAVDLRAGRAVRLVEGDFGRETAYTDDPVGVARRFAEGGAPWIHVVDLDAARTGEPTNRAVIEAIVASVTVPVQVGGGVRRVEDAAALFAVGVTRVVVGTAAVSDPEVVGAIARRWPQPEFLGPIERISEREGGEAAVAVHRVQAPVDAGGAPIEERRQRLARGGPREPAHRAAGGTGDEGALEQALAVDDGVIANPPQAAARGEQFAPALP